MGFCRRGCYEAKMTSTSGEGGTVLMTLIINHKEHSQAILHSSFILVRITVSYFNEKQVDRWIGIGDG